MTREGRKISGITVDSGAGTPEFLLRELKLLEIMEPSASAQLCGLCDIMSVFCAACNKCIGAGSLEKDSAIQLLHTVYAFFTCYQKFGRPS